MWYLFLDDESSAEQILYAGTSKYGEVQIRRDPKPLPGPVLRVYMFPMEAKCGHGIMLSEVTEAEEGIDMALRFAADNFFGLTDMFLNL